MCDCTPLPIARRRHADLDSLIVTHDGDDATMKEAGPSDTQEYPCLVRVTNGKGVKFSTKARSSAFSHRGLCTNKRPYHLLNHGVHIQVESSELIKFHSLYGSLLKSSMTATLRKRDKKREKSHAEEAAKRKKKMTEPVKLEAGQSHKRGKGRRQHQRKIKALLKQQEAQKKHKEREEAALKASAVVV